MEDYLYHYKAEVIKVYDGDTITVNIDLGLNVIKRKVKIRLARINAPELKGVERTAGLKSRDFLRDLILNKKITIQTIRDRKGKYGRYLGEVWFKNDSGNYINVNDLLVSKGLAKKVKY